MPPPEPLVRVVRSGFVESLHLGDVAVCDADGRVLARVGDPDRPVFARSSMKPLQAAVSIQTIEPYLGDDLGDDLVAIMCASHNGEPEHVRAVRALLRSTGAREAQLRCPPALPARPDRGRPAARPRPIFHNCSGKHAGMIAACLGGGWPAESYGERSNPLQRRVLRAVQRATDVDRPALGVDGCGVPVFGLPLSAMATLFARFGRVELLGRLAPAAARAVRAMQSYPFLVAGTRRTDTSLMQATPGIVAKGGAEALHCAALLNEGIGIAVKIADGGERAAGPALVHTLTLVGAITERERAELESVARRPVLGGRRPVGAVEADFRLHRVRS
ncbi:MAG TPA: asparaginase [Actinomycetota bacterium]|nr:asparaginase [Actinomycetota bacterium]